MWRCDRHSAEVMTYLLWSYSYSVDVLLYQDGQVSSTFYQPWTEWWHFPLDNALPVGANALQQKLTWIMVALFFYSFFYSSSLSEK